MAAQSLKANKQTNKQTFRCSTWKSLPDVEEDIVCTDDTVDRLFAGNLNTPPICERPATGAVTASGTLGNIIEFAIYLSSPARRVITRCCFLSRVPSLYSHLSGFLSPPLPHPLSLSLFPSMIQFFTLSTAHASQPWEYMIQWWIFITMQEALMGWWMDEWLRSLLLTMVDR